MRTVSRKQAALNILWSAGLVRIDWISIRKIKDEELKRYRGCGPKTLQAVREIIDYLTK